jgi:hypothetical protein
MQKSQPAEQPKREFSEKEMPGIKTEVGAPGPSLLGTGETANLSGI